MPYADYSYYTGTFGGSMTEAEFARMAAKASRLIDVQTFDRAAAAPPLMQQRLADCCCALADRLLVLEAAAGATWGGLLTGATTDGYSESYAGADVLRAQTEAAAASLCRQWLSYPVNLVYRG